MTESLNGPLANARAGQAWSRFWRKWRRFDDRASVSELTWMYLLLLVISLPVGVVYGVLMAGHNAGTLADTGALVVVAVVSVGLCLALVVPWLALVTRRLRDAGIPAVAALLSFIPVANLVLLVLLLQPSLSEEPRARQR